MGMAKQSPSDDGKKRSRGSKGPRPAAKKSGPTSDSADRKAPERKEQTPRAGGTAGRRSKRSRSGAKGQRDRLEKELVAKLHQLDDEDLLFLVRQVHVLVHNKEVDRINAEIDEFHQSHEDDAPQVRQRPAVDVEEGPDRSRFFVILGGARKLFTREEMRSIVRLSHAGREDGDAESRLYRWLKEHRSDVLMDGNVRSSRDQRLADLVDILTSRYKAKGS
jgi:hypothetical protein